MARNANTETDKVVKEEHVATPVRHSYFSTNNGRSWLYGVGAFFILLLVFALGVGAANHHRGVNYGIGTRKIYGAPFGGGFGMRERGFMTGGTYNTNGQTRAMGVVTSVSGSNFTIAGNGSTTNVTTSSSTQYQGGNQVKQNDTVVVWGTSSSGTITATQVSINP